MVLSKRNRNGEFIAWNPPGQPQMSMSQQPEPSSSSMPPDMLPTKRTRTNPPRSSKAIASEFSDKSPKPPVVKKARASRAKRSSAPSQPAPAVSVMPEAGPSEPPPKKGRKKAAPVADASGSEPEKRGAIFKPKCPQNILDRVERVMTQRRVIFPPYITLSDKNLHRIFMIDRNRVPEQLSEEFSVLGSTGNVSDFRKSGLD